MGVGGIIGDGESDKYEGGGRGLGSGFGRWLYGVVLSRRVDYRFEVGWNWML